jgi:hypothetical protein
MVEQEGRGREEEVMAFFVMHKHGRLHSFDQAQEKGSDKWLSMSTKPWVAGVVRVDMFGVD